MSDKERQRWVDWAHSLARSLLWLVIGFPVIYGVILFWQWFYETLASIGGPPQ